MKFSSLLDLISSEETKEELPSVGKQQSQYQVTPIVVVADKIPVWDAVSIITTIEKMMPADSPYIKFKTQCNALKSFVTDETTLFQAALATLEASGITLQHILDDIRKRQNSLESVWANFQRSLDDQKQQITQLQQITTRERLEIESLQRAVESLEVEKQRKLTEIQARGERVHTKDAQIEQLRQDIEDKKRKFEGTTVEVKTSWQMLIANLEALPKKE